MKSKKITAAVLGIVLTLRSEESGGQRLWKQQRNIL